MPDANHSWRRAIRQTGSPIRTQLNGNRGGENGWRGEGGEEVRGREMSQFYKREYVPVCPRTRLCV